MNVRDRLRQRLDERRYRDYAKSRTPIFFHSQPHLGRW